MGFLFCLIRRTAAAFTAVLTAVAFGGAVLPCAAAPPATPTATPTARYAFDEGTGRMAAEASGDAPATLRGNAMWGPGLVGEHALQLTGARDGCAEILRPVIDTARSYTVMAWVRVNRVGSYQTFVSIDGGQISGFFLQLREDTSSFAFAIPATPAGAPGGAQAVSLDAPEAGVWYHLTGVCDMTAHTASLYVDGLLQEVVSLPAAWSATGRTAIGRGEFGGHAVDWANADIDDVRFYQSALTPEDIRSIALANLPPSKLAPSPSASLQIDADDPGPHLNPMFYGLMTEEINWSLDGGVYAELIQNRNFMDDSETPVHWSLIERGGAHGSMAIDSTVPLNAHLPRSLRLTVGEAGTGGSVGAANDGFWGIAVRPSSHYQASFFAKSGGGSGGPLTVSIESADGATVYAHAVAPTITADWHRYTVALETSPGITPTAASRFVLSASQVGTVWISDVSLFPHTFHDRPSGNRVDLMEKMAALNPAFLRLPGGNYLEGDTIATRFDWKKTLGPREDRPGHMGVWGYRSSDGMGLLEMLEWCEDLHMEPLLAVYAGYSLNQYRSPNPQRVRPGPALQPFVDDALDEIEYVTGDIHTKWGAIRARDGHPAPFPLHYVEVGNEDGFDDSGSYDARFAQFFDAIRAAHPDLQIVATSGGRDMLGLRQKVTLRRPDVIDEHYYYPPREFEARVHQYDSYSRTGPKVFVGEWASLSGHPTADMNAALGDAAFLTGMERNCDVVILEAYSPLLVQVNSIGAPMGTTLIGFDALSSYGSPSYWMQVLFANHHGDTVLPAKLTDGPKLACSVTRRLANASGAPGAIYIKLVNPAGRAQTVHVNVTGENGVVAATGSAITLSSAGPRDTNTIGEPNKIVPVSRSLTGLKRTFDYLLPAYSITVLDLPTVGP